MSLQGRKGKGRPLILIQSQLLQILGNSEEEKKERVWVLLRWVHLPSCCCSCSFLFQPLSRELYYYYIMELAFYWSLMFSQFIDVKRKVSCQPLSCCLSVTTIITRHSASWEWLWQNSFLWWCFQKWDLTNDGHCLRWSGQRTARPWINKHVLSFFALLFLSIKLPIIKQNLEYQGPIQKKAWF